MKVFKFGGASVSDAKMIRNTGRILSAYKQEKLLIVVSAMGKTTNALEKVAAAFYSGEKEKALRLFEEVKQSHLQVANELLEEGIAKSPAATPNPLQDFFTEVEWLLHDKPVRDFDYYYDQIVCVGELLSTAIVSNYLNSVDINNAWLDVRDILRTDNNFRDAGVDWTITTQKINEHVLPAFAQTSMLITQGFIGATDDNESTTLGREGSDYSAAVFANLLNAESQTIWKDVQGVMNADPKLYPQAQWIKALNYREVIEMAYYGAQVIHPKTIKPLQNKDIPLYVKSFIQPEAEGTYIHHSRVTGLPPIIVYKKGQVLMKLSSKDYSFVEEQLTAEVYSLFEEIKFKPNLIQTTAISLLCVVDDMTEKVAALAQRSAMRFDVQLTRNLTLLTIRHYTSDIVSALTADEQILLRQQTPETIQVLLANSGEVN